MSKKQHPLKVEDIMWGEYGHAYMSKGHHDPETFCDAVNETRHILDDALLPSGVKQEYWRYCPWEYCSSECDGAYVKVDGPARGAFPVTFIVGDDG